MNKFKILMMTILVVAGIANAQTAPQSMPAKTLQQLNQQIIAAKQNKNLAVRYFEKVNTTQIQSERMVLGTQELGVDFDGTSRSDSLSAAKIPTWEIISFFGFEGTSLTQNANEFLLTFYVYNAKFPSDSELIINADGQEMKFVLVNKGRKLTSDYKVAGETPAKDRNTDDQRSNAGNRSQDAKPFFSTFKLTRAEFEKVVNAEKTRVTLSKQYQVNLRKEYKATLKTILDLASL